jgi:hypothetical protein
MHTRQIIRLTKLLTANDMGFYGFAAGAPVHRWSSDSSSSSQTWLPRPEIYRERFK